MNRYAEKWNMGAQALVNKIKETHPNIDVLTDLQNEKKKYMADKIPYNDLTQKLAQYAISKYGNVYVKKDDIYGNLRPSDKAYYDRAEQMLRQRGALRHTLGVEPRNTTRASSAGEEDPNDVDFGWRNLIAPQYIQTTNAFKQVWNPGEMIKEAYRTPVTTNKYGGNIYGNRKQFNGGGGIGPDQNYNPYSINYNFGNTQNEPILNETRPNNTVPYIQSKSGIISNNISPKDMYNNLNSPQAENNYGQDNNSGEYLNTFKPDYIAAGLSALPNIGMGIANMNLANNIHFNRNSAQIMQPDYLDPTRAIQESRNQFAGTKDTIRQNAGGSGSYLSNMIGATGAQSEAASGIQSKYDEANANIYNQTERANMENRQRVSDSNSQIQQSELMAKTQLRQQGSQNLVDALNTGEHTYYESKRDADEMNIAGGQNFFYKRVGGMGNQTPVKVFKGNGYHYYEDPNTGQTKFLDPKTGKIIKDKTKINDFTKDKDANNSNSQYADMWKGLSDSDRALAMKYLQTKRS